MLIPEKSTSKWEETEQIIDSLKNNNIKLKEINLLITDKLLNLDHLYE